MNYNVIHNGEVINTILGDANFAKFYEVHTGYRLEAVLEPDPTELVEPTPDVERDALLVDHEYRLTLLELGVL